MGLDRSARPRPLPARAGAGGIVRQSRFARTGIALLALASVLAPSSDLASGQSTPTRRICKDARDTMVRPAQVTPPPGGAASPAAGETDQLPPLPPNIAPSAPTQPATPQPTAPQPTAPSR